RVDRWAAPETVGWVLPCHDGRLAAGLASGPHWFDPQSGRFERALHLADHPRGARLNDATTDRDGRIWFGTMDDGERAATGRLYRWDARGCRDSGLAPVAITNGPAISADAR